MAQTVITSTEAAKLYSGKLFVDLKRDSFFVNDLTFGSVRMPSRKTSLANSNGNAPIYIITDLKAENGDEVSFPLFKHIEGEPVYGDSWLEGSEKSLSQLNWKIRITQLRQGIDTGGKLTKKRTPADIRAVARTELRNCWADILDESFFVFLTGERGISTLGWRLPTTFAGWKDETGAIVCPVEPVDTAHKVAINSTGQVVNDPAQATEMELSDIDKIKTYIRTQIRPIPPVKVNGQPLYILVIHPRVEEQLRTANSTNSWIDIQKMANVRGMDNPIFKSALGMYAGVVLVSHEKVPVVEINGQEYAVNIWLGSQALGVAFGNSGTGFPFNWKEKKFDYDNRLGIATSILIGARRIQFDWGDGLENYGSLNFYTKI